MTLINAIKSLWPSSPSQDESQSKDEVTEKALTKVKTSTLPTRGAVGVFEMEQDVTGYKAVQDGIAELTIPKGATVVSPGGKKLRTDKMIVDRVIRPLSGVGPSLNTYTYSLMETYRYEIGECNKPEHELNTDPSQTCASGLHFFRKGMDARLWYQHHA